jgi:hypothetical protein
MLSTSPLPSAAPIISSAPTCGGSGGAVSAVRPPTLALPLPRGPGLSRRPASQAAQEARRLRQHSGPGSGPARLHPPARRRTFSTSAASTSTATSTNSAASALSPSESTLLV